MKIELLKEFIVFARYLNFSKAARYLCVTQPVLSTHISSIEKTVGTSLVDRRRPIRLTPAGERFADGAEKLVAQYESLIENCKALGESYEGRLRIEDPTVTIEKKRRIKNALVRFSYEHPHIRIEPTLIRDTDNLDALRKKMTDVVFVYGPPDMKDRMSGEFQVIPIDCANPPHVRVWVHKSNPLSKKQVITSQDLEGQTISIPRTVRFSEIENLVWRFMDVAGVNLKISRKPVDSEEDQMTLLAPDEIFLSEFDHAAVDMLSQVPDRVLLDYVGDEWTRASCAYMVCRNTDNEAVAALLDFMAVNLK